MGEGRRKGKKKGNKGGKRRLTLVPSSSLPTKNDEGDRDFVKPALEKRGTVHFGRVNMKPGKPLTFATLRRGEGELPLLAFG